MTWKSALFHPGRMDRKTVLFLSESRMAHDRITNLLILTYPLFVGAWQFRTTAEHFAHLADPVAVRDAVLSYIRFPDDETAVRKLDFKQSVKDVDWERQRDAAAEMMFLVTCSIFENFTSHLQDLVFDKSGVTSTSRNRQLEKGFQFPSFDYDLTHAPARRVPSAFSDRLNLALAQLPTSDFMTSQTSASFPVVHGRDVIEDLEMKMHAYLLFKKLRNSIAHGRFDSNIPHQYEVVDKIITIDALDMRTKPLLSTDGRGNYFIRLYDVIGFTSLILKIIKDIDFMYLLSIYGEADLLDRLRKHKDSRQDPSHNQAKELTRLKLCLRSMGVDLRFQVNDVARVYFKGQRVWR
jgi:hypothetical protein